MSDHARENCTRCNELEAEVAQLRQGARASLDSMSERLQEQFERLATALGDVAALEAARDHLRARLRHIVQEMRDAAESGMDLDTLKIACLTVNHWADLLAVLTEPPQEEKEHNDNDLARVVTMGEGTGSRTASEVRAGSVGPMTPDQKRNQP